MSRTDLFPMDLNRTLENIEKSLIVDALAKARTKTEAARLLGIDWRSMRYRIGKYGLERKVGTDE